ncbi:serine hydrolase, partial [Chryseobacterium sp. SIMBA_029]
MTGLKFENFLSKHLLAPLGMNDTGLDNNRKVIPHMSSAYDSSWNDLILCEYMDMSSSFSAGAMYSTVNDLYLWDQALYSEKLV